MNRIWRKIANDYATQIAEPKRQEVISKWEGIYGQRAGGFRTKAYESLSQGILPNELQNFRNVAFPFEVDTHFLFRGFGPIWEFDEIEYLTATSLSCLRAFQYMQESLCVIYIPNKTVFGLPIKADDAVKERIWSIGGTEMDKEILLVDPERWIRKVDDPKLVDTVRGLVANHVVREKEDDFDDEKSKSRFVKELSVSVYEYIYYPNVETQTTVEAIDGAAHARQVPKRKRSLDEEEAARNARVVRRAKGSWSTQ